MHVGHGEGFGLLRTKGRGFTLLEFAVALAVFALIAGVVTLAVGRAQLASAGTRLDRAVRAEMLGLLDAASTGAYSSLVTNSFARPSPCTEDALSSCVEALGRTFTVDWAVSAGSDLAGVSTVNPASITLTTSVVLPGGRTVSASRTVVSPNGGRDSGTGLVRVRLSGAAYEGPVYLVDASDAVAGAGVASSGIALLRASAEDCSRSSPCRVSLGPSGETVNSTVSLDAASVAGASSQVVVSVESTTDVGVVLLPVTGVELQLIAVNEDGTRARPSAVGSVCLYLTFFDGVSDVSVPACNTTSASLVRFSTYAPFSAFPERLVALPQGEDLSLTTDHPDGSCPLVPGQKGWDGASWVATAVCTSWTWGPASTVQIGVNPLLSPVPLPAPLQAPTSGSRVYEVAWSSASARPATGYFGESPWQFPRVTLPCSASASCLPPSSSTALPSPVTSYSSTGAIQTYTVPSGVERLRVYAWGAGGGGGLAAGSAGGSGGYAEGIVDVDPSDTLYVAVGVGGANRGHAQALSGAGGGLSGVFGSWSAGNAAATHGSAVVVAGGGGGGGSDGVAGYEGGNGGGLSGGVSLSSQRAGSQSAGGVFPGSSAGSQTGNGSGAALRGGNGCGGGQRSGDSGWPAEVWGGVWGAPAGGNGCAGAGGGSGFYGAAGGTDLAGNGGSAGGGSGYAGGSAAYPVTSGVTVSASVTEAAALPPRTFVGFYQAGVGAGGPAGAAAMSRAGAGLVVIEPLPASDSLVPELIECPFRHCNSSVDPAPELTLPRSSGDWAVPSVKFTPGSRTSFVVEATDFDQGASDADRIDVTVVSAPGGLELVDESSGSPSYSALSSGGSVISSGLSPASATLAFTGPVSGSTPFELVLALSDGTTSREVTVVLYPSDSAAVAYPAAGVIPQGSSRTLTVPIVSYSGDFAESLVGVSALAEDGLSVGSLSVSAPGVLSVPVTVTSAAPGTRTVTLSFPGSRSVVVPVVVTASLASLDVSVSDVAQGSDAVVSVSALNASGGPLANADVSFRVLDANGDAALGVYASPSGCRTGVSGSCSVDLVAEGAASSGSFTVVASSLGVSSSGQEFEVTRSTSRLSVTGVEVPQGGSMTATVRTLDGQGQPVEGAVVSLGPRPTGISVGVSGPSSAAGVISLSVQATNATPVDVYPVTVSSNGVTASLRIEVTPKVARISLPASIRVPQGGNTNVTITVTDTTGAPVANTVLSVIPVLPVRAASSVVTNASGVAVLNLQASSSAARGTYSLRLESGSVVASSNVFVAQGVASVTVSGQLSRGVGSPIVFLLRDSSGAIVTNREFAVTPRSKQLSPDSAIVVSDDSGKATLSLTVAGSSAVGVTILDLLIDGRLVSVGVVVS